MDGGQWRATSTSARSRRPMRAGRRSTTSSSARCSTRGRKASIAAAERIGGRILDVGIGTGISLPDYSRRTPHRRRRLSPSRCCARRTSASREHKLAHVEALAVMDAQHLGFPDAFFDVVVAQYVITTVPDPEATLDEFARVTASPAARSSWSTTSAPRPGLRRAFEQWLRAGGAPARLAAGIPLGAAGAMGRAARRRARDRAPPDAAARAFLADPVREAGGGRRRAGTDGRGWPVRSTLTAAMVLELPCPAAAGTSVLEATGFKCDIGRATGTPLRPPTGGQGQIRNG